MSSESGSAPAASRSHCEFLASISVLQEGSSVTIAARMGLATGPVEVGSAPCWIGLLAILIDGDEQGHAGESRCASDLSWRKQPKPAKSVCGAESWASGREELQGLFCSSERFHIFSLPFWGEERAISPSFHCCMVVPVTGSLAQGFETHFLL